MLQTYLENWLIMDSKNVNNFVFLALYHKKLSTSKVQSKI